MREDIATRYAKAAEVEGPAQAFFDQLLQLVHYIYSHIAVCVSQVRLATYSSTHT